MFTCPNCGRMMSNRVSCVPGKPVKLVWNCPLCGHVLDQDRSGYTYFNVVDKYGFENMRVGAQ